MSNPNVLLSEKVYRYINQGSTLKEKLMRAAHSTVYFDLSKLNSSSANILKAFES